MLIKIRRPSVKTKELIQGINMIDFKFMKHYPQIEGMSLYKRFILSVYRMLHDDDGSIKEQFRENKTIVSYARRVSDLDCNLHACGLFKLIWKIEGRPDNFILDLCPILDKYNRRDEENVAMTVNQLVSLREEKFIKMQEMVDTTLVGEKILYVFEANALKGKTKAKLTTLFPYALALGVTKLFISVQDYEDVFFGTDDGEDGDDEECE